MRRRNLHSWITMVLMVSCGALLHSRSSSQVLSVRLENGVLMNVSIQLSPPVAAWDLEGQNEYFGGGYHLSLEEQNVLDGSRVKVVLVRDDQQKFTVQDFHTGWELTDPDLYAIWTYNHVPTQRQNFRALATGSFSDLTTPNSGIPYALAASREGRNLLAIGVRSQSRVINLQGHPLESGGYQFSLDTRLPFGTDRVEEVLYTDTTPENWFSATRQYAAGSTRNKVTSLFPSSRLVTIRCTTCGIGLLITPTWGSTGRLSPGPGSLAFDPIYLMQDGSLDPANCSSGWRVRSAIIPLRKTNFPIFLGSFSMSKISCG